MIILNMRKKRLGRRVFQMVHVLFALLIIGIFMTSPVGAVDSYKFGLAMPMTGSQALFGADQVQAAMWAIEDINKAGGIKGTPLEAIVLDTQANPKLGISMATRLATVEKVPVFVTAWSSVVAAVAPVADRYKVLCLSIGANSPRIATLGDYVYTAYPLSNVDITAIAKYSYDKMGKRTAAVMYINNDTGIYAAELYQKVFAKVGGKIVSVQAYEPTSTDYTAPLLQIKEAKPDIIHLQGLISDSPQVIAQMRQMGITQTVTSYQGLYNQKFLEQVGDAVGDIIIQVMAPPEAYNQHVKDYLARWQDRKGRVPYGLPYTQYVGDSPYIIKSLYEYCIDNKLKFTGENMRKALLAIKTFKTPLVGETIINEDHTVDQPVYLMRVVNGKFTLLDKIGVDYLQDAKVPIK